MGVIIRIFCYLFVGMLYRLLATCFYAGFLLNLFFQPLKMEAICSSETSVCTQWTTRLYIPEDDTLHNRRWVPQILQSCEVVPMPNRAPRHGYLWESVGRAQRIRNISTAGGDLSALCPGRFTSREYIAGNGFLLSCLFVLQLAQKWRRYVLQEHRYVSIRLQVATSKKIVFVIVMAMIT
jgi:hypothetical protein